MSLLYVLIFSIQAASVDSQSMVLPSLFLDPQNPMFSCKEPTVYAKERDELSIICPDKDITLKEIQPRKTMIENLYNVADYEHYKDCNATGGIRLLRCYGDKKQRCNEADCTQINHFILSESSRMNDVNYKQGKTYYFISTGFRESKNLDNKLEGSCSKVSNPNEYKMRFKIHICTDEEISNGKCKRCETEECYYRGCQTKKGEWKKNSSLIYQNDKNGCFIYENREIVDVFSGIVSIESRNTQITCPELKCAAWINTKISKLYYNNKCYNVQTRKCNNNINGKVTTEERNVIAYCPPKKCSASILHYEKMYSITGKCYVPSTRTCLEPWLNITFTEQKAENVSCDNYKRENSIIIKTALHAEKDDKTPSIMIAVFSSIACFIIGVVLGSIYMQYQQKKLEKEAMSCQINYPGGDTLNKRKLAGHTDSPYYFVDGMVLQESTKQVPSEENARSITSSTPNLGRSVSFNNVQGTPLYSQIKTYTLPRNQSASNIARAPSTTSSQILLLRQLSDVSDFCKPSDVRSHVEKEIIHEI